MATNGNLDRWSTIFAASLVPQILGLVLDSWKKFKTSETLEVPITQEFFVLLNSQQELSELPFLVDLEVILPNADGSRQKGRLDLRFIHGYRRKVYFSLECKRLRVKWSSGLKSLAGDYVEEGMFRYFNGQYAEGLDKGGMLGYVMDGEVDTAIKDVAKAIENRKASLYMRDNESLKPSSCLRSSRVKETCHDYGPKGKFIVYHVFVNGSVQ